MTATPSGRRLTLALFTLAGPALLIYPIGAPHEHGGWPTRSAASRP